MKKIVFVFAFVIIFNQSVFSQNAPKHTIQASLFLPLIDLLASFYDDSTLFIIDVEGQYKINNYANISLMLSSFLRQRTITDFGSSDNNWEETSYTEDFFQIKVKPTLIYRPRGTGLKGFYLSFYPSIGMQWINSEYSDDKYAEVGLGTLIGYKWINRHGFTMQVGGGVGKTFTFPKKEHNHEYMNSDGSIHTSFTDVYIMDLKFGYSW